MSVTRDGTTSDLQRVKWQDIMLDSSISQSSHVDVERALERWVPDKDDSQCPELENISDNPWNRLVPFLFFFLPYLLGKCSNFFFLKKG